jgi:hypothetical protein
MNRGKEAVNLDEIEEVERIEEHQEYQDSWELREKPGDPE